MRTSVLDELCGPLSDAVADMTARARILEDLADHNLLVLPLDRHREWYRYHQLLRDHLHAELRLEEPDEIPSCTPGPRPGTRQTGCQSEAIEHAQVAGDADRVAELVLELMGPVWASGRVDTVLRWMQWLEGHPSAPHYSAIMAHGALIYALLGRAADAERWAEVAERQPVPGVLPDGSSVAGTLAYLRANLAREGMPTMRRDARDAWEGPGSGQPVSPDHGACRGRFPLARGRSGDRGRGPVPRLGPGCRVGSMPLVSLILAERCVVATERNDWSAADSFAQRALRTVDDGGFDGYWTSALVFATAARSAAHGGRHADCAAPRPSRSTAAPVAHLRAPRGVGSGTGRARPRLPGFRRSGRRRGRAEPGGRHLAAAPRPRHAAENRRAPAGESGRDPPYSDRSVIAHGRGAETCPACFRRIYPCPRSETDSTSPATRSSPR